MTYLCVLLSIAGETTVRKNKGGKKNSKKKVEGYDDDLEALMIQPHISTWSPELCIAELLSSTLA